jgi:hypothetical protein
MSSLSTVYAITTVLSSIAGMGAAFIGNRIFPLTGGSRLPPPTPAEVEEATRVAADKAQKLAAAEEFEKKTPEPVPEPVPELVKLAPENPEDLPEPVKLAPETLEDLPEPLPEPVPEPVKLAPENPEDLPESVPEPVKLAPENPEEPPENPEDEMPVQAAKGRRKRSHK